MQITANQIKTRWTSIIEEWLWNNPQVFVKVRWEVKYVIISIDNYSKFRELELDNAIKESMDDIKNWKYTSDIENHLTQIHDKI